ncbi:MAG: fibronectin type III domain-containing protein [Bacteroidota bacterium]|nr:fibronectin type III domain-containing protein [Bacteroidota bacterium]
MKRIKVLLDFIHLTIVAKIAFYRNVLSKLNGHPSFLTTDVSLAEAKAAVDKLEELELAARDGSRTAIAARNAAELVVDNIFRILAANVERVAAGDEALILSTGFNYSGQPVAAQKAALAVEYGENSGSVKLIAKAVDRAGSYVWQISKSTTDNWTQASITTRSTYEIPNLEVGVSYFFRVAAVTPDGMTDFTDPVKKVII